MRPCLLVLPLMALCGFAAPKARCTPHSAPAEATADAGASRHGAQGALAEARQRVLNSTPLAMFYYSNDSLGLESLQAHAYAMTLVGPQCYELNREGVLHGQFPEGFLEVVRHASLPLMPLVTNRGFDRATAHALLHNVKAQERAAKYLANLAARDGYVGWQLDIENIAPADELAYTRFVARVAARLHRAHRLLSVAVVPRFSDTYPDSPATEPPTAQYRAEFHTDEWGAAFDYRELGNVADFLVLMAYDQHTSSTPPGPVAGYDWTKAALDYAVRCVPPAKLLLGVPLYGREWIQTPGGTTSRSLAYEDLKHFHARTEQHWDDVSRTAWFQLRDGDAVRTAWFDDARSLREKLNLVQAYHLRGYAAWRLGVEDPAFWQESSDGIK